jgi:hypothetical protein
MYIKKLPEKFLENFGIYCKIYTMGKFVITEEEKNRIKGLYEQVATGTTPNTQYMSVGTKFCYYGSCRVDIKVIDKTTSKNITSKGADGADINQIYPQVIKLVQDDLASRKITGVTLPTVEQLEDLSPTKK